MTFYGYVDDAGKFALASRTAFAKYLAEKFRGQNVVLTVKKKPVKRSLDQNAYWWAVPVVEIANYCGCTPASMHYDLLGECFGYKMGRFGKPVPERPSSSLLSKVEFSFMIEWVLDWAPTTLGVAIEPPQKWFERVGAEDAS